MLNPKLQAIFTNLNQQADSIKKTNLNQLFKSDPKRSQRYQITTGNIFCDYSKNHLTDQILDNLLQWARQNKLEQKIKAMFLGEKINNTEQRAVLHPALRCVPNKKCLDIIPKDIQAQVLTQYNKMSGFVKKIHNKQWLGGTGLAITDIVNIGIGGSDLGPKMITKALSPYKNKLVTCHFVSNIDATDLLNTINNLNPETTLFIICSKSFTTLETLQNAISAKNWISNNPKLIHKLEQHFIAVTSNISKACEFGVNAQNCFEMWDWVGGRYSVWSTIGMPIALATSMDVFLEFLEGGSIMDEHFLNTPLNKNLPAILALISCWYINFWGTSTHAILPYDQLLEYFPDYLQQAQMESNGKSVDTTGEALNLNTSSIIWGGVGTNGQHAYFQLLHQGSHIVPTDFIVAKNTHHNLKNHQDALVANCFASAQALMQGISFEQAKNKLSTDQKSNKTTNTTLDKNQTDFLAKHKVIAGNKPSTMLLINKITPSSLGALTACYEHNIFTQSVLWDINAFDQWGVELGKVLAKPIMQEFAQNLDKNMPKNKDKNNFDTSTNNLIKKYLKL